MHPFPWRSKTGDDAEVFADAEVPYTESLCPTIGVVIVVFHIPSAPICVVIWDQTDCLAHKTLSAAESQIERCPRVWG